MCLHMVHEMCIRLYAVLHSDMYVFIIMYMARFQTYFNILLTTIKVHIDIAVDIELCIIECIHSISIVECIPNFLDRSKRPS